MSFQEAQPLSLEWFGGVDSSTPPNDLPPYLAVTAQNCVFPESCVGSRPGFTAFDSGTSVFSPQTAANSLKVIRTVGAGNIVQRHLLIGFENGMATKHTIDAPATTPSSFIRIAERPQIITAAQYFERAIGCTHGATGYGTWATVEREGDAGLLRHSAPSAPTLSGAAGGYCTPGQHWFALSVNFVDGSQGPLGEAASIVTTAGQKVTATWTVGAVPTGSEVASVYLWMTTANNQEEYRRVSTLPAGTVTVDIPYEDVTLLELELIGSQPRYRTPRWPALAVKYAGRVAYFGESHRAVAGRGLGGSIGTDMGRGSGAFSATAPGGWTVVSGAGYGIETGFAAIRFDGATAARSLLRNTGLVEADLPGVARKYGTGWQGSFGVRISYLKSPGLATGSLKFGVTGTTGSTDTTIDLAPLVDSTLYTSELLISGTFSSDIKLFFEAIGPGVANEKVYILACEAFDPANTSHRSTVWWSEPLQARVIDSLYGGQTYGETSGEQALLGFEWQGRFCVATEKALWATQQTDGYPSTWPTEKVSDLLGVCGRRAIAHGPDFKVLINDKGAWLYQGAAIGPDGNLSREILEEWADINWAQAWQIWGEVDHLAQRVYIGVPTGTSTYCNALYVLDYSGGFGPGAENSGRRWSVWPIEARGGTVDRRAAANQSELWIPRFITTASEVGYLDPTALVDWGTDAISFLYETGRIGADDGALGLFRRMTVTAEGSGLLSFGLVKADGLVVSLPAPTLYTPMRGTQHVLCNVKDERVGIRIAAVGAGARLVLHRLALWMRRNPFGDYRVVTP